MLFFLINFFLLDKFSLGFVKSNFRIFKSFKTNAYKKNIILIEFNNWKPFHVSNSYLLNYLIKKYNAKAFSYEIYRFLFKKKNLFETIKWHLGSVFKLKTFYIYYSFNVLKFLRVRFSKEIKYLAKKSLNKKIKNIKTKKDIERIIVEDIWIGDIFYDSYLKKFNCTTIEINSNNFVEYFHEFLCVFYYWHNFIKNNKVKAVLTSHGVYAFAIPLRIATYFNIDAFVANEQKIYRYKKKDISLKKNSTGNFAESKLFKLTYLKADNQLKKNIISEGKKISNEVAFKNKKLFYLNNEKIRSLKNIDSKLLKKKSLRVLISPHAFSDSPHVFGKNLFVDFEEWFQFLDIMIKKTDYEWFIKPHPNLDKLSLNAVDSLIYKNKNLKILNASYNINHLNKMKIDFALTIFGVIAREYPLRKINVINASRNNPHSGFKFSYTCKNLKNYKEMLLNLNRFNFEPNKKDLYIYHYMNDRYFNRNFLFQNYDKEVSSVGGIKNFYNYNFYKKWLSKLNEKESNRIFNFIKNFVESKDYALSLKHQVNRNDNKN